MMSARWILLVGILFGASAGLADAGGIVGGHPDNSINPDVLGGTIGGGGLADPNQNRVTDNFGTVGGGIANRAGDDAGDRASATRATVAGGLQNTASGEASTVAGGDSNVASGFRSTVGGGASHVASGEQSTIAGGGNNDASATRATVGGGGNNDAIGENSTVSGGLNNTASGLNSTVCGGGLVEDESGTTPGNVASGTASTVGGGTNNTASGDGSFVGGGASNVASGPGFLMGLSVVGGGLQNTASGDVSFVGGGIANTASGNGSMVPGGEGNVAAGTSSFAAGSFAEIGPDAAGAFAWADSTGMTLNNGVPDSFVARASNGFIFYTSEDQSTGAELQAGQSAWTTLSDRNAKADFAPVDTREILEKLTSVPIQTWHWKGDDGKVRHIGPVSQDFHAAFEVGFDDEGIETVDADGVALAAIQGLFERLEDSEAEMARSNADLEARLAEKDAELAALRDLVDTMNAAMIEQEARLRAVATRIDQVAPVEASLMGESP